MILPEGTLLHGGTYKIVEMLGQGSFGITYLANHTALEKKVAIKEFFMKELNSRGADGSITGMSDGSLSYNYGQKFKKEALNLSRLEHPNIVRVTDSFEENGTFYYVMDYIDGMNLNDYIKRYHPSEQTAVEIIKKVANALEYMHDEKHMLHLDLKPGNIMRRKGDGHIFLIDFGLSKHYDGNGAPETSTTIGLGTAGYAPIEQSNQAKNGEFRPTIDVYALGATFYKLLTGETPPVASELVSDDELLKKSLRKHGVSGFLALAVVNAMMPSVKKRTQSIRAFIDTLPSSVSKTSSNSSQTDTVSEETEYINKGNALEETEYVGSSIEKHPDFDEAKYVVKGDYAKYPTLTRDKADKGDREAMLVLGITALRGEGTKQDFDIAYGWFSKLKELGDDRGEKIINQWTALKSKYNSSDKKDNNNPKAGNTSNTNDSNPGLWIVGAIVFIVVLIVGVKSCKEKREAEEKARIEAAAAAKKSRIESIARNTKDWYGTGNGQFYCMIDGERHYVSTYGIPDGQRTVHYSNGDTFVGTVKGGSKSQGKYTYKNGDYFNGTFSYGSKDTGYGKETSYDGERIYEGNYRNGMWNGAGIERWPKEKRKNWSCELKCTYKDNLRHGVGTWYYNNHTYEKVRFANGKMTQRNIEEGTWR